MFKKSQEVVVDSSPEGARTLLHALGDPQGVRMLPVFGDLIMEVSRSAPTIRANGRPLSPGRHLLVPGDRVTQGKIRLRLTAPDASPPLPAGTRTMARAALASSPASCPNSGPSLVVMEGGAAGRRWPLVEGRQVVGRSLDCDIVLTEPSVSRRHAEVVLCDGRVSIRDLGSRHGTRLGRRKVKVSRQLGPGQEMVLGLTRLRLVCPERAPARGARAEPSFASPKRGSPSVEPSERAGDWSNRDLWIAAWALGLLALGGAVSTLALAS